MKVILFMNHELNIFMNQIVKNIHERLLNVFMNYSWMFLNNTWDFHEIHELST